MLQKLNITNFRCFRSLIVPLRPFTVLIGPNDTGKSAFLAAVQSLATGQSLSAFDFWRGDPAQEVRIQGTVNRASISVTWHNNQRRAEGVEVLDPVGFFHLSSRGLRMVSQGVAEGEGVPTLNSEGDGTAALLDFLLREDRSRFFKIVDACRSLVPGLEDILVRSPVAAQRRVDLVLEKGLQMPAERASSGVRIILFFVCLAYHPTPPRVILLEEPETAIHPRRLAEVVSLLRDLTQGKHGGHPVQIIATTHSPYLLDLVRIEQDQVLVFDRNEENGSRTAEPVDATRLKGFLDDFLLGETWYNLGEEGLVAQRP